MQQINLSTNCSEKDTHPSAACGYKDSLFGDND